MIPVDWSLQDMHYAEFAEDEVSSFVRLTAGLSQRVESSDPFAECGLVASHQGL